MSPPIRQQIAIMLHVMKQIVLLLVCIDYCNKICVKSNLLCCSIVMPCQSAWQHLYENADSRPFTLMTGLSRGVFQKLMDNLSSQSTWSRSHTGRPYSLSHQAQSSVFFYFTLQVLWIWNICAWILARLLLFAPAPLKNVESNSLHIAQTSICKDWIPWCDKNGWVDSDDWEMWVHGHRCNQIYGRVVIAFQM